MATNTGTVPLSDVRMTDELPGLTDLSCDPAMPASLEPDDELSCTATRTVTQDDLDFGSIINIAQVSAEAPGGDADDDTDDISAIADVTVDAVLRPRLTLTAEVGPDQGTAWQPRPGGPGRDQSGQRHADPAEVRHRPRRSDVSSRRVELCFRVPS